MTRLAALEAKGPRRSRGRIGLSRIAALSHTGATSAEGAPRTSPLHPRRHRYPTLFHRRACPILARPIPADGAPYRTACADFVV